MNKLVNKDLFVSIAGELMSMAEAHQRWGEGAFPTPIVGNCFSFQSYSRLPLATSPGWISEGILPLRSKMLVFGLPKSGKSYLASQLSYSVAEGVDWLGFAAETPVDEPITLYVQSEIAEIELQKRLSSLSSTGAYAETIHNSKLLGRNVNILEERLAVLHPNVLVLDPLYMYIDGDLNKISDVTKCNDVIDQLIEQYGCSVVVVHHCRKPSFDGTQGLIEALGSIAITAFYDSILWLERKSEKFSTLHFTLRNAISPEPVVLEQQDNGLWKRFDPELPVISVWTPPGKLSKDLGIPSAKLQMFLEHLLSSGKVEKNSFGQFRTA